MARRDAHLDHLAKVPLFAACTKKDLRRISRVADELTVVAGRHLVQQGAIGREAFVILEGQATVRRNDRKVATLGPGSCFGELALLSHQPRSASVAADTPLTVLVIGAREFAAVLDEVPSVSRCLLAELADRVRVLDGRLYG